MSNEFYVWLVGAVICFYICFRSLYKRRKEFKRVEQLAFELLVAIFISCFSWVGVAFIFCLAILIKEGE